MSVFTVGEVSLKGEADVSQIAWTNDFVSKIFLCKQYSALLQRVIAQVALSA